MTLKDVMVVPVGFSPKMVGFGTGHFLTNELELDSYSLRTPTHAIYVVAELSVV